MYEEKVYNTAMGMVQDQGIAEDIAQEVFVTVYKSVLSLMNGLPSLPGYTVLP